jgi:hypothetical protein
VLPLSDVIRDSAVQLVLTHQRGAVGVDSGWGANGPSARAGVQVDTIIFDKTGTLTHGKPWVTDVQILDAQVSHRSNLVLSPIRSPSPLVLPLTTNLL